MSNTAVVWIRDDLRTKDNPALSYSTRNHENVTALFIYNSKLYDNKREAQKWWLYKSLENLKIDLLNYNIELEILEGEEIDIFNKIKNNKNISFYWNKVYEPDQIKNEEKIIVI